MNSQISLHCRRQMQSRTQFHVKLKISTYEFHIINILRILRQFFFIHRTTMCLRKTKPLQLISHNFTNSQRSLTIFWHIDFGRKFLNWLRTSCVVSITTTATWHTWTADFWADFEQRITGKAINEWQNDCGAVSMPKDSTGTCVVTVDRPTAKHFIIPIETLFV